MIKTLLILAFSSIFISQIVNSKSPESLSGDNLVILEEVTLIDGQDSSPISNAVIVIDGSHILRIGKVGDFTYPTNAKIMQLNDRFIIPGLIDVHTHIQTPIHNEVMKMLLAYGITTIRIPGGTDIGVDVKKMVAQGKMIGPNVFTGGSPIDGEGGDNIVVRSEKEMRQEIRRQYASGVDLIKLYVSILPDLLTAGIDEAHKLGLPVIGHLSSTFWTEAAESGIDGLVHSGSNGPLAELISLKHLKRLAADKKLSLAEFREKSRDWGFLLSLVGEPVEQSGQRLYELIDINGPEVDRLIKALLKNNTMVDPTLVTEESLVFGDEVERVLSHLDPYKTPKSVTNFLWGSEWESGNRILRGSNKRLLLSFKPLFKLAQELTLRFFRAGVTLGAGSDVGMPWMTPGASFHRELEHLVDTGIPIKDVLQIATRNGSQFVYRTDEIGTIEVGKFADIVVLKANPLEDIRNTRKIEMVIKSGKTYYPNLIFRELEKSD